MALSRPQIIFVVCNVAFGAAVALALARVPAFAALPIPLFGWLVAGVLLTDIASGYFAGSHPTAVISMPARIVALVLSFLTSLVVSAALNGVAPA